MKTLNRLMIACALLVAASPMTRAQEGEKPAPAPTPVAKTESKKVVLDVKTLVGDMKVSLTQALAAALKAKPGTAVAAQLEGAERDGKRTIRIEVVVQAADAKFYEVKLDPATAAVNSVAEELEEDELKVFRSVAENMTAIKITLADAIAKAESFARGTVVAAAFEPGQAPSCRVTHVNGAATLHASIDAASGALLNLAMEHPKAAKAPKGDKGESGDKVKKPKKAKVGAKADEAADSPAARAARAAVVLTGVKFTHPRDITNPFVPLAMLKQDILEGTEAGKHTRVERTARPDLHKSFQIGDQSVEAFVVEDREFEDGQLSEVATDYFAQDDNGTVYYLGEDVDEYAAGKVTGHKGSWMFGKDTPAPGVLFPGQPKAGAKWRSEDVSKEIWEIDEIVSMSETVTTPAGTFENCIKVKESLAEGTIEYKYYARGVGVVREVPPGGDELLKSHTTNATK